MDTKKFRIVNKTRDHALSQAITLVDSTFEPLTVLRVMVEGLAHNEAAGLWLTRVSDLPSVPRLAPFDVVYLDKNQLVVEATELLPASRLPRFRSPATTALILPFQTISTSQTTVGDELEFCAVEQPVDAESSVQAAAELITSPAPDLPVLHEPVPDQSVPDLPVQVSPAVMQLETPAVEEPAGTVAPAPFILASAMDSHDTSSDQPHQLSAKQTEPEPAPQPLAIEENAEPFHAEPASGTLPAVTRVSSSELELASALDRALASAEQQFETTTRFRHIERVTQPDESVEEPAAEPAQLRAATSDAAELLRNSRALKRRPSRQSLSRARKSRAGLRRPEPGKLLFAQLPETAPLPETDPISNEQPSSPSHADFEVSTPELAESIAAPFPMPTPGDVEPIEAVPVSPAPIESVPVEVQPVELEADSEAGIPAEMPVAAQPPLESPPEASREAAFHIPSHPPAPLDHAERDSLKPAEPVIGRFLRWLYPAVYQEERRSSVRWPASGLVAYQIRGESLRKLEVRNISSSGIYVLTGERWKPGEMIQLSLQKNGLPEQRVDHRVEVEAGAVRFGSDGVGLTFALPAGTDLNLWDRAIQGKASETGAEYIVKEIRMARALGCLRRICAPALNHVQMMLHKEFSNVRVANAIKIILKAENLLTQENSGDHLVAHPETVVRILELGSWVDTDWIEDLWAGLMATSCTVDGQDRSNLPFVEMLSQFAPIHLRVLGLASAKARHEGVGLGLTDPEYVTAGELARALDVANLTKILRTIAELAEYGLLSKAIRSPSSPHDGSARTTVTQLGLEMFARCHGLRETIAPAAWHGISTVIVSPAYTGAAGFMAGRRS